MQIIVIGICNFNVCKILLEISIHKFISSEKKMKTSETHMAYSIVQLPCSIVSPEILLRSSPIVLLYLLQRMP